MNSIQGFFNSVPGEKDEIKDVDIYISNRGDLQEIKGIDVIIRSILNILFTVKGSYIMDPEYGCGLHKYIFEPCDDVTLESIQNEISMALLRYEGRAKVNSGIAFLQDGKGFVINLTVDYRGETKKTSLMIDESLLKNV